MKCLAQAVLLLALGCDSAWGGEMVGVPRIVDGDTVQIGSAKIRLAGIDAPETDQLCLDREGKRWACGIEARDRLIAKAGSKVWSCRSDSMDRYGRALAACQVERIDINRWLVREGWALAFTRYAHTYDSDEAIARQSALGLWSGAFIAPWDWRSRSKGTVILGAARVPKDAQPMLLSAASAIDAPSPECAIKGNRTGKGECIYHLPGGRFYSSVKMDLSKGKRWFCSEAEAEAAGCRHSIR
jgi:endonuclease YncB( thermonuclease family)